MPHFIPTPHPKSLGPYLWHLYIHGAVILQRKQILAYLAWYDLFWFLNWCISVRFSSGHLTYIISSNLHNNLWGRHFDIHSMYEKNRFDRVDYLAGKCHSHDQKSLCYNAYSSHISDIITVISDIMRIFFSWAKSHLLRLLPYKHTSKRDLLSSLNTIPLLS